MERKSEKKRAKGFPNGRISAILCYRDYDPGEGCPGGERSGGCVNTISYVGKHALTWAVSRHMHRGWELIYCTSGSGELTFADRTLGYGVNDVAVIPPMVPHSNMSETGFTNIHINLTDAALACPEPMIVRADSNGFLLDAFTAAFYYYSESKAGHALLPLYGQLIVASLMNCQPGRRRSDTVQQIEDDILKHYPDCSYDLNAYLSTLPFNTEYLKKMFKKETGMTPLQYLTEKRLENAASTLATYCGRGNISETARLCGFSDPLYFSRLFKRKYGVSPRSYSPEPGVSGPEDMKIMV